MKTERHINPDYVIPTKDEYIASISYGKDSLAMLEIIWEYGYPLTQIVTVDIMATPTMSACFEEVEQFKKRVDTFIEKRYTLKVKHLKADVTFEDLINKFGSFPGRFCNWCNSRLKIAPMKAKQNEHWYIGYAIDEHNPKRQQKIQNEDLRKYPLCQQNFTEKECMAICEHFGIVSPTYKNATRDGCWFCYNQNLNQLRHLRYNHPGKWAKLLEWDDISKCTFRKNETIHDLDKRFQLEAEYQQKGLSITSKAFYQEYNAIKEKKA